MEHIPHDIFFNIFSRLPIHSLLRFRSVSKQWKNAIDDPLLIPMHLNIPSGKSNLVVMMQHPKSRSVMLYMVKADSAKEKMESSLVATVPMSCKSTLQGSCNGILCFVNYRYSCGNQIFICNPYLNEVVTVLAPRTKMTMPSRQMYGLGYSPSTKEYKILQVTKEDNFERRVCLKEENFQARVYCLRTNSWKDINSKPPYPIHGRPAYANGALHWMIDPISTSVETEHHVVSFDMEKEEFHINDHPNLGCQKNELIDVIELEGNLGLVDYSYSTHIDIWILKDWEKKEWVRQYSIAINAFQGTVDNGLAKIVGFWNSRKIFFTLKDTDYISYDPKTNKLECLNFFRLNPGFSISEVFAYTGSLVSPKSCARGKEKLSDSKQQRNCIQDSGLINPN